VSLAIEVTGVTKAYATRGGERLALDRIDLRVAHGEFVCLLGPSGCGKTTLLNILSGARPWPMPVTSIVRAPDGNDGHGIRVPAVAPAALAHSHATTFDSCSTGWR
jgi:ABC-type glutathione transport system ATPase component